MLCLIVDAQYSFRFWNLRLSTTAYREVGYHKEKLWSIRQRWILQKYKINQNPRI